MASFYTVFIYIVFISSKPILSRNWRQITVLPKYTRPEKAALLEGNSLTIYCGSSSNVSWSFSPTTSQLTLPQYPRFYPVSERHIKGYKKIKLMQLSQNDSGYYYCRGTYRRVPFISPVLVYVENRFHNIGMFPTWVEVPRGDNVTLTCGSVRKVDWYSKDFYEQEKVLQFNVLTLFNMKREYSGPYVCRVVAPNRSWTEYKVLHSYALIFVDGFIQRVGHT